MLGFHRAVKVISKNETVEVVSVAENGIAIRSSDGTRSTISKRHAGSFDVLEAKPIEVSAGDRLLLTANRRDAGLRVTNGELVTVSGVDALGRIQLEDGRQLPANYRSFAHGYAVTAHRSQGKTVDSVILSGDGMQKELFYVAASRGRHSVTVITSDKERLQETVGRSMARTSASELLRDRTKCTRRGAPRGIEMAREMVRRAAAVLTAAFKQVVQQEVSRLREERSADVNMVSVGNAPWVISAGDPVATLEIVLLKQTVVLSWNQFVYAEGDSEQVRIAFASHDVVVKGAGLDPLLSAIAAHRVVRCARAFVPSVSPPKRGGSFSEIVVRRIESEL